MPCDAATRPTGNSPVARCCASSSSQPYTDMPTKKTCSPDCMGSPLQPATTAHEAELTAPAIQHNRLRRAARMA